MVEVTFPFSSFTSLAPGGTPQAGQLFKDLSEDPAVSAIFSHTRIDSGVMTVFLTASPDASQSAAINAHVSAHDGLGTPEDQNSTEQLGDVTVETLNGVDFAPFISSTNDHISSTSNPHGTGMSDLQNFDLSTLNSKIADATLDRSTDPRPPSAHASNHSFSGSDPLVLQNLSNGGSPAGLFPRSNGAGGFDLVSLEALDRIPCISIYNTLPGTELSTNGSFSGVQFDGVSVQDSSYFSFSPGSSEVVILVSGQYEVNAYFTTEQFGGNNRSDCSFRITRTLSTMGGMESGNYSRQISQGVGNSGVTQTVELQAGDVIRFEARRNSGSGQIRPVGNGCGMVISLKQGIRGPQGEQGIPGVGSTILLDQDGVFSGVFSHINFVSATVTDAGGGQANVQFNPASVTFFIDRADGNLSFADGTTRERVVMNRSVPNGTYEVKVYAEHYSTSTSTEWEIYVLRDGVEIGRQQTEPEDNDDRFFFNFFDVIDVTSGSVDLRLRIRRTASSGTVNIRRARIMITKLT